MLKKPNCILTRVYSFALNHHEEKSCMEYNKRVGLLSTLLLFLFVIKIQELKVKL